MGAIDVSCEPVVPVSSAQEAAHRLLVQLRSVARRLPGTLDPACTADALLLALQDRIPVERGAVLMRSEGQGLTPLAYVGPDSLDWDLRLSADTGIAEAWASQDPQVRPRRHARNGGERPPGSSLAVPLTVGIKTFGIVAIESCDLNAYPPEAVAFANRQVAEVSLSLDTGLLFDEVRAVATAEERQRLAREVHDGIAQELVYLGYTIDDVLAERDAESARALTKKIRGEVTRLVVELRMSLFNLRSAVDPQAGLGAALSEHMASVAAGSDLTVHLNLSENGLRLAPDTEAELLRIAQEAAANARKHSGGRNLWVTCTLNPPSARLVIEDDGSGITARPRTDSYGMQIMRERAERLRGHLVVDERPGGGTRVSVSLGRDAGGPAI